MPLQLTLKPEEHEIYRSDFDVPTTAERLHAQDNEAVSIHLTRTGKTEFDFEMVVHDEAGEGRIVGQIIEGRGDRARLRVMGRYRRNRNLAAVLVPVAIGITVMFAVETGTYAILLIVPIALVIGSGVIDNRTRHQRVAMRYLRAAIEKEAPPPRRRRVKKRQWGKPTE